jgi:hypothetical protein
MIVDYDQYLCTSLADVRIDRPIQCQVPVYLFVKPDLVTNVKAASIELACVETHLKHHQKTLLVMWRIL